MQRLLSWNAKSLRLVRFFFQVVIGSLKRGNVWGLLNRKDRILLYKFCHNVAKNFGKICVQTNDILISHVLFNKNSSQLYGHNQLFLVGRPVLMF